MTDSIFLGLKDNQLVLFADILGFKNAVERNMDVDLHDKGKLIVNFPVLYNNICDEFSPVRQEEMNIKFLWVSDSIIISTSCGNADALFNAIDRLSNILYCASFSLRGAIALGKLYHERNIWGPAYIEAVELESKKAVYPRVIFRKCVLDALCEESKFRSFIELSENHNLYQYNFFDSYLSRVIDDGQDITANLSVYIKFIKSEYEVATSTEIREKFVWLAEKLLQTIKTHNISIDEYIAKHESYETITGSSDRLISHLQFISQLNDINISR